MLSMCVLCMGFVFVKGNTGKTQDFAVRMNNSFGNNSKEGRLEIYYNGSWGTVCSYDGFTNASARVACASLGFGHMGEVIGNRYGAGADPIWLDGVNCTGTESGIEQCIHNGWGVYNCSHYEDVSISCECTHRFFYGSGKISSPNFPLAYANNLNCYSHIMARKGQKVTITFMAFTTDSSQDSLQIWCLSGNYTSPRYAGSQIPASLTISLTISLVLRFQTDGSGTSMGFSLTYNITSDCVDRYFYGLYGQISSPNFPLAYSDDRDCSNFIAVPPGQYITITFLAFNTESRHDYVKIMCSSGDNYTSPRYSGSQIPGVITISSCDQVNVYFHSDRYAAYTGFNLTYNITSYKVCPDELDKEYSIHWSRTKAGTESYAPCPKNNSGTCSRECKSLGIDGNPLWSAPNCNGCFDKEFKDLLEKVNKVNLTAFKNQTVIAKIASQLSTVTNKSEGLSPGNLNASVMMIKQLADLRTERTINANAMEIKSIVQAANNVLQPNNSKSWQELEDVNKNIATSILFSLDVYGRSLAALNTSDHSIEVEDSLVLEAWSFEKSNLREIDFPNRSLWDENRGDGISISVEAFKNSMSSESPSALHMWGSYYRTVNDYLPGIIGTDDVNSRVLSFSIDGLKTNERLERPVLITLRHNQEKRTSFQRTCAFWNFSGGNWDSAGCSVTSTNLTHTICSCDHLTNFAILMSLEPKEDWLLSLISIIGCSISVAALILTIFVYALTWKQAKSAQATVLLNLCVALIIAYIIFMVGADKVHSNGFSKIGCQAVAVLLHYFFLAAFFIMLAEGVELLLYIIFVFHVRRTRETVMLVISAWVLPLIIVGVSLGSTKLEGYGHETACWLSSENHLIWAFVGPVLGIIAANFVILIIVLRWRSQKKALLSKNVKKRDEINATIWNLAVTCPVLGLGWLFGFLTLAFDHTVFQYMFVAVNSVQGLLIFIFHALFHNKRVNERISSLFSTYICSRCRNSDQAVITQSTSSSQDQPTKKADKKGRAPRGGMGKQGNVRGHGTQLTSFGDSETMESTQ